MYIFITIKILIQIMLNSINTYLLCIHSIFRLRCNFLYLLNSDSNLVIPPFENPFVVLSVNICVLM